MTTKRLIGSAPSQICRNKDHGALSWQTIPSVGQMTYTGANTLGSFASNANSYNQLILQNTNAGSSASSDLIVSNDSATDSTNYGDFGINSSAFSGSGPFSVAGGVYLYSASGPLALGTAASSYVTIGTNNAEVARFDSSGNLLVGGTSVYSASITSYGTASRSGGLGIRNSAGTAAGGIYTYAAGSGGGSTDVIVEGQNSLQFYTNATPAERMRIDSSGNLMVGGTAVGNGGTVSVTGTISISNSTTNTQTSMSKEGMQQTSSITTSPVTIFTSVIQGLSSAAAGYCLIYGSNNAGAKFFDVVIANPSGAATVITSTTVVGSPAARTYAMSTNALQLTMASGTYSVNVKCTSMGYPF